MVENEGQGITGAIHVHKHGHETEDATPTLVRKGRPETLSVEDRTCPYSPLNYVCKGYIPLEEYQYFDGVPGSPDQRFLVDLETDSKERLYDVRPYLYAMGYWYDEMTHLVPAHSSDRLGKFGDPEVESYYVRMGREFLRGERTKGHGYFLGDRDRAELNEGALATMPFHACQIEELPGDVGIEDEHVEPKLDIERGILKTNIRTPLPDLEVVIANLGGKDWDRFIRWLYTGQQHPMPEMVRGSRSVRDHQHQRAISGWMNGVMIKESIHMYPDPQDLFPISMRPAQAREYMASIAASYRR